MNITNIIAEKINAIGNPNGKTIIITDEICFSWGIHLRKAWYRQ